MRSKGYRCFVPAERIHRSTITIDDVQQVHHIRDVLRLKISDRLACFDGQGREYAGTIVKHAATGLLIRIDRMHARSQRRVSLWLAVGLLKADRFDWVVQKSTELGVTRISPLITSHTVVRPHQFREAKLMRWQRIATEAATQSGRTTIPQIDPPQSFEALLPCLERHSVILMPTLSVTALSLSDVLKDVPSATEVAVLIGPEGDFSREEVAQAQAYGARPVSLGPLTLRAETAALATLSIVSYTLGAWSLNTT
ncbi:MAG: 16S rRNA (uracil(1498)-N(3))-methyltransferase [Candidatus Omnitrophica bacterium]|nr:16S rRNA (uracil(1498)-N(3))-methyltransferase [Candidatus Omnitrophota bacterium]